MSAVVIWKIHEHGREWRGDWRDFQLAVRPIGAMYEGSIDGCHVLRARSHKKAQERLSNEVVKWFRNRSSFAKIVVEDLRRAALED